MDNIIVNFNEGCEDDLEDQVSLISNEREEVLGELVEDEKKSLINEDTSPETVSISQSNSLLKKSKNKKSKSKLGGIKAVRNLGNGINSIERNSLLSNFKRDLPVIQFKEKDNSEVIITDTSCNKGCCSDKKQNEEETLIPTDNSCESKGCCTTKKEPEDQQKIEDSCKKGCCGSKAEDQHKQLTLETKEDSCKKGCCGEKVEEVKVEKDDCESKGCCSGNKGIEDQQIIKNKVIKSYCCEICINGCCKSSCCTEDCCVTYSISLPNSITNLKSKTNFFTSFVYNKCGGLSCIKLGSHEILQEEEEDGVGNENQMVTIELEKESKVLYLKVKGMTCADCVDTLNDKMKTIAGIESITTSLFTEKSEIKYYESVISITEIIGHISNLGFTATQQLEPNSTNLIISTSLSTIDYNCGEKGYSILNKINIIEGVSQVKFENQIITISYDSNILGPRDLFSKIKSLDTYLQLSDSSTNINDNGNNSNQYKDLLILGIILCCPVIIIAFILPSWDVINEFLEHPLISSTVTIRVLLLWVLSTPIQFILGRPLYIQAYKTLVYAKKCSMDLLIMISSSAAYFYSLISLIIFPDGPVTIFFETSAILLTLIILGRYLEVLSKGHTTDVLKEMLQLQSTTAILVNSGNSGIEDEIDIKLVQVNDILLVKPFSKVPVDGMVVSGSGHIDESMITGESKPRRKDIGDLVIGGSMNQSTSLNIQVTKNPNQSTISNICRLIEEAQASKPPFQSFADTIASYFVPCILGLACIVFIVWIIILNYNLVVIPDGKTIFTFSLSFAMSVLVISCPCAVSLSTPTAIMVSSGVAAKLGILFKGGDILELAHKIKVIVFDKTGTLTHGKMELSDFKIYNSMKPKDFFYLVGSAESISEHLIGRSLTTYAKTNLSGHFLSDDVTEYQSIPGKGMKAIVDSKSILIGNQSLLNDHNIPISNEIKKDIEVHEKQCKTVIIVVIDNTLSGLITFQDEIKPESSKLIEILKSKGILVYMLSGDNESTCKKVSQKLGISSKHCYSNCSPTDKFEKIKELQNEYGNYVAMVGDGINDSIALTQSDISISIASGTDIAIESAKLILMKNNLLDILVAMHLSETTFKVIKMNLLWAFIYNSIGIPLAVGLLYPFITFYIPPSIAGLSELLSSLPVILFSLLLNKYSKPHF